MEGYGAPAIIWVEMFEAAIGTAIASEGDRLYIDHKGCDSVCHHTARQGMVKYPHSPHHCTNTK